MRLVHKYLLPLALVAIAACNNESGSGTNPGDTTVVAADTTTSATKSTVPDASALAGCYSVIHGRDTSTLQLEVKGVNVTGPLVYSLYEKDRNDGTLQAEVKDNLLTGWYFFKSEGIMSVRQVIWKIHDGQLWPGMGEMRSNKDSLLFKNAATLQYDSTHPFTKVPCVL